VDKGPVMLSIVEAAGEFTAPASLPPSAVPGVAIHGAGSDHAGAVRTTVSGDAFRIWDPGGTDEPSLSLLHMGRCDGTSLGQEDGRVRDGCPDTLTGVASFGLGSGAGTNEGTSGN
jgi:hypothetical protein